MNRNAILLRETAVSIVINSLLSIAFFVAVFGLDVPVPVADLGPDFLPQTFMIALMGSLVPALLLRRKLGGPVRPVVLRALAIALASLVVIGGGALLLCLAQGTVLLDPLDALAVKAAFGAFLSVLVTPLAILPLFHSASKVTP